MAFATNRTGNGAAASTPFLTEKDLIRQVASNMTKQAIVVQKTTDDGTTEKLKAGGDSKRLMAENTAKVLKVWHAFVKFCKNQITVNGRLVDTTLVGLFAKDANGDVMFMPSPDYLEAGKFKLQKGNGSICQRLGLPDGSIDLMQLYQ